MMRPQLIAALIVALLLGFASGWLLLPDALDRTAATAPEQEAREIRYWVAPMDPNYRRDQPGKSPMGMDLVPVYAEASGAEKDLQPALRIDPVVSNNIGVKTTAVRRGDLPRLINTVGHITPNEHRLAHVHVRSEGWIEQLAVHTEGASVSRGEVLFEFYAPALVSAQREYLQALNMQQSGLIAASAERLQALGLDAEQISALRSSRQVQRLIEVRADRDGYVMELNVRHGMYVTPDLMVMSIADLNSVWVDVDVFEQHSAWLQSGQKARMRLPFAPDRVWTGNVDYIYPTLRASSRTLRARLVFDNADLSLKPNMYASVQIDAETVNNALLVPQQAVIRSADQQRVIVALDHGRFRPAQVHTGVESAGMVQIRAGLSEGERVVVSGQFLLDSEASLDAGLLRMIAGEPIMQPGPDDMSTMDHGQDRADQDGADQGAVNMEHSDHAAAEHDHD
jgi:Cu(I)/Ag(I) efflux system membrane fusion protein